MKALERLVELCASDTTDIEKLSAYFTLLFLYHEDCEPLKEEVSSYAYNLKEVIRGLGFSESQARSAAEQLRGILKTYLDFLDSLGWEERRKVAGEAKAFIENALSSRCKHATKLHLDRLKTIINNADSDTRRALAELRNLLAKHANKVYGLKLEASDEAPLVRALGEFKLKELFKIDSAYDVERLLQSMGIGVCYWWSSRKHDYNSFLLFPAFFSDELLVQPGGRASKEHKETPRDKGVRLEVAEARQRDVGRKIARIDREVMRELGVEVGDFIEIEGPKGIAIAQVWPLPPGDISKRIVRIDGFIRKAIGVGAGDYVTVRRAYDVRPAERVVLASTEPIRFGSGFVEYVKEFLMRKPVSRGEIIIVPVFGTEVRLAVVSTQPSQHVYITERTGVLIREEPVSEVELSSTKTVKELPTPMSSGIIRAREDLERVVAQALKALGFQVWTNVRKIARRGAAIEVDVWAEKRVGDTRFKVYVSCKNWNRDVDRSVVDEEFGRVFNLQEVPHLRILVVKSMSRPAKEVAEADGFFVIEVGEKATRANADEIYKLIYRKLSEIFTSIAPPQLLEIAKKVSETAKELNKIAQELAKLSQNYQAP